MYITSMPNKWTIKQTNGDTNLFCRTVLSDSQRAANYEVLINKGMSKGQAELVIAGMNDSETIQCNKKPIEAGAGMCFHYIASYGTSGDIICYDSNVFVIMDPAEA